MLAYTLKNNTVSNDIKKVINVCLENAEYVCLTYFDKDDGLIETLLKPYLIKRLDISNWYNFNETCQGKKGNMYKLGADNINAVYSYLDKRSWNLDGVGFFLNNKLLFGGFRNGTLVVLNIENENNFKIFSEIAQWKPFKPMISFELMENIDGKKFEVFLENILIKANYFSLAIQNDTDMLEILERFMVKSFNTKEWYCFKTNEVIPRFLFEYNMESKKIILKYFDSIFCKYDLCFYNDSNLVFGSVSHAEIGHLYLENYESFAEIQNGDVWKEDAILLANYKNINI